MHELLTPLDSESDQLVVLHQPPKPTHHSGDQEKAAGPSVEMENDQVGTVRALLEKQSRMSLEVKNPDAATVTSKTRPSAPVSRRWERPQRQGGNDGTDDTAADDTDFSAECYHAIHRATFPEPPQMTNSPPAVVPQQTTTIPLSVITTHPQNSPSVHSDISNPVSPNPIAAGGSRDPPVPDANHPGETTNEWGEWPSPKQPNKIN